MKRTGEALDGLYEAVAAPEDWPSALQRLAESLGGAGCLFTPVHQEDAALGLSPSLEFIEACEIHVRDGWFERDFRLRSFAKLKDLQIALEHDFSTEADRRQEPYYQEFLRPLGLLWFAAFPVSIDGRRWHFSLQRAARLEPYTPADGERILRAKQHLQAILSLASKLRGREALGRLELLEQLGCAAMLIDWRGRVIRSNAPAGRLIGAGLSLRGGHLAADDRASDVRLQAMVRVLLPGGFSAGPVPSPIAVRRPDRRPIVVEALPLAGLVSDLFQPARALLLFTDLDTKPRPDAALAAQAFNLTSAEARLAQLLAGSESLEAAAEALGITKGTARVKLQNIFAKTDTHRQAELVALVARLRGHG